jgi:hypothetical protein
MHNPLGGFCYAASEAIYHLSEDPLEPWWVRFGPKRDQTHWFLRRPCGWVVDVTASQFSDHMLYGIYEASRRRAFGTPYPSRRACAILERIDRHYYFSFEGRRTPFEDWTDKGYPAWVRSVERRAGDSNASRSRDRHA